MKFDHDTVTEQKNRKKLTYSINAGNISVINFNDSIPQNSHVTGLDNNENHFF